MLENLNKYDIILASGSPRRRELLSGLGLPFRVSTLSYIDESYPADMPADDVAEFLSHKKAEAYLKNLGDNQLIITADTVVVCGKEVIGKPADAEDARRMLKRLSGNVHHVVTGVTVTTKQKTVSFSTITEVSFAILSDDEISYYISHYQPFDKAGAYGIQEWIGFVGVEGITGSYFNVMGLPIQRLYQVLKNF